MKTTKYILYWAHLPEHTNPLTEGYIGITKQSLKNRMKNHELEARKGSNNLFKQKIREYGDLIIWEVIARSFSKNGAQTIEKSFRPIQNIAWNTQEGGGNYPILSGENNAMFGKKGNLNHNFCRVVPIEERIKNANSWNNERRAKKSLSMIGEKNPMYGKTHNEESREKISLTHKGKKISIEHIESMRPKLSVLKKGENNPMYHKLKHDKSFYIEIINCKIPHKELAIKLNTSVHTIESIRKEYKKGRYDWLIKEFKQN